jgi:DNA-binding LytR/AlgR family response regulator
MRKLKCAICEDEEPEYNRFLELCHQLPEDFTLDHFTDGSEFLASYYQGKYDLIFMDIYMKTMNGVETVAKIREVDDLVPIAFVTTSQDHFADGYRLRVNRYIEKPLKLKDIQDAFKMGFDALKLRPHITVKSEGKDVEIMQSDIIYVEQSRHHLFLHISGGGIVKTLSKLDDFETQLPHPPFYRCHKSYLVNLAQVASLDKEDRMFVMKEGDNVYIRRASIFEAARVLKQFLFSDLRNGAHHG